MCKAKDFSLADFNGKYAFTAKTPEENSLVCLTEDVPPNVQKREDGFKAFYIEGELDFSLIGILSKISGILADNNISVFAVSTYNTDYIFVKEENFENALDSLRSVRFEISSEDY